MISREQLAQRRDQATKAIETVFETTISIDGSADMVAARWSLRSGMESLLAGDDQTVTVAFRIRRELLTAASVTIVNNRSHVTEAGKRYRVTAQRGPLSDPSIVLDCTQV